MCVRGETGLFLPEVTHCGNQMQLNKCGHGDEVPVKRKKSAL